MLLLVEVHGELNDAQNLSEEIFHYPVLQFPAILVQDSKLQAVVSTMQMMAGVVDAYILTSRNSVSNDAVHTIASLYQEKAKGEAFLPSD